MYYDSHTAELRRERLRQEGKIELPLNVDTSKYILSAVKYRDVLASSPLLLAGLIILFFLHKTGIGINAQIVIIALAPWMTFLLLLSIHHPDRKNISLFKYRIVWRLQYNRRQKLFVYSKGDFMQRTKLKDVREQLGITNIYSDCYETLDKRLVKVIKVSSVNLSLLNVQDKNMIFQSYETFLNDLPKNLNLQISQIAQPINLDNYYRYIQTQKKETDRVKNILINGYLNYVDDIQKSKNMVSRNRYVIISKPFNNQNKERVLDELERETKILTSLIENMLGGRYQLKTKVLNNDELFHLIYTCIDYENAQISTGFKTAISLPITVGKNTYQEMSEEWEKSRIHRIL